MLRVTVITLLALLAVAPFTSYASGTELPEEADDSSLEMVVVTGVRSTEALELTASQVTQPGVDNSDLLRLFPGGNRNSNGPMTRISQYRGLYGAQNNVAIDGQAYTSGGPNWMDSPLSSIPRSLTQSVTLYRGLGSVALIEEGLGGIIAISSRNGGFSDQEKWNSYGQLEAGYGNNANSWGLSVFTGVHNEKNQLDIAASVDKGDDYEFGGGTVAATSYDRSQYRLGYGHRFSAADMSIGAVINRTGESGTPALPMDIIVIDSEFYSFGIQSRQTNGDWSLKLNRLSVEHLMNNFTLRPTPTNITGMKMPRETLAFGDSGGFKLSYARDIGNREWLFGIDGKLEEHDADLSNPANGMFYITNFNATQRDRVGLFGQVVWTQGEWDLEAGLRYNQLKMDADEVGGNLAIMPMPMPIPMDMDMPTSVSQQDRLDELANDFNESERKQTDNQWSGIFKTSRQLGPDTRLNLGLGRKVRSPSYQERYLWLPMESTAGLADGFTYIGDIDLKPETSIELTAGIDWSYSRFKLTPELYYRDVKNYIQGVPSTNTTANMFAMMMSGRLPLQFANVDAKLYGLDLGYEFEINESWLLRGNLAYVRGKRTDVPDNLYRIAPLSSFLELVYQRESYFFSVESLAASKQDKVSVYNDEKQTAGWGSFNLRGGFTSLGAFAVSFGVENVLDKTYQDHLGGYNRVAGSDVPLRERLYSKGRNYYIRLNASW